MLKTVRPLGQKQEIPDPVVACAICGKQAPLTHYMSLYIGVGCPGAPGMQGVGCGNVDPENHWACSLACWKLLAQACLDEHLYPLLLQMHAETPESTHCTHAKTILLSHAE